MPAASRQTTKAASLAADLSGRDEMNLSEFPIALADRAQSELKTLYFHKAEGKLTVTGSDAYGLPTSEDSDVIVALMHITKMFNNFNDVSVNFSRYQIIKLLGWNEGGRNYARLEESLNRWMGVLLVFDKCWWDNKKKRYVSAKMHILEDVILADAADGKRQKQADLPLSVFKWNQTFIQSCQADNLRLLDLSTYFSLKSAVAKRLYRFLGKRFYHNGDLTFDLKEIAFDRVGLSRSYEGNAGKIKAKLQDALAELESIGFLQPLSREERYTRIDRGQWKIRLSQAVPGGTAYPELPATLLPAPSPLLNQLIHRGVTAKTAANIVERHTPEGIAAKIEVFDWLVGKADKRIGKSPAGYLVKSINDDYASPKGFVSAAEQQKQAEAKQQVEQLAEDARRRKQLEDARERALAAKIATHRKSLSPEQLAQAEAEAIAGASVEIRESLDSPAMRLFRQTLVNRIIDEHLGRILEDA